MAELVGCGAWVRWAARAAESTVGVGREMSVVKREVESVVTRVGGLTMRSS